MATETRKTLGADQREALATMESRFQENERRHVGIPWSDVLTRLEDAADKLWSLQEMERSGGEPDVIGRDEATGEYLVVDCSAESPEGRRAFQTLAALTALACYGGSPAAVLAQVVVAPAPVVAMGVTGETDGLYFESLVDAAFVGDGTVWVLDRGQRTAFKVSEDGRVLSRAGAEGEGPGEFRDPVSIVEAGPDSLVVFDRGLQRISVFDAEGRFRRATTLRPGARPAGIVRSVGGKWLAVQDDRTQSGKGMGLFRDTVTVAFVNGGEWGAPFARVPATVTSVLDVGGRTAFRMAPFTPSVILEARGSCALVGATDESTVTVVRPGGGMERLAVPVAPRPVREEDWTATRARLMQDIPPEAREQVQAVLDDTPRPDALPGFAGLVLDATGLVWVQRWEPPLGPGRSWRIHGAHDTSHATIDFGRPVTLFAVSADLAVGTFQDDFGADVLAFWRVERGPEPAPALACQVESP